MRPELLVPEGELNGNLLADVLGLIGVRIPESTIAHWTRLERVLAYDWAIRQHLRASDSPVRAREKPWFVTVSQRIAGFTGEDA